MLMSIDAGYFVANSFIDSTLFYDGGPLSLGESNKVVNSILVLGPHAKQTTRT